MAYEINPQSWPEILAAARQLGVKDWALRKWEERGVVPGKWQIPIIVQSRGRVSVKDFTHQKESV